MYYNTATARTLVLCIAVLLIVVSRSDTDSGVSCDSSTSLELGRLVQPNSSTIDHNEFETQIAVVGEIQRRWTSSLSRSCLSFNGMQSSMCVRCEAFVCLDERR